MKTAKSVLLSVLDYTFIFLQIILANGVNKCALWPDPTHDYWGPVYVNPVYLWSKKGKHANGGSNNERYNIIAISICVIKGK